MKKAKLSKKAKWGIGVGIFLVLIILIPFINQDVPVVEQENEVTIEQPVTETIESGQAEAEAQARAIRSAKIAKDKAEQEAWEEAKPGLCRIIPGWTREECQRVIDGKIWVGMTYEMLVVVMFRQPDIANPSNYGQGTEWQWCWHDKTPSCFYDHNDDGIIDAYN